MEAALVYSTFPSRESAEAAGRAMVVERHAACANVLQGLVSIYRWQGELERAEEAVLLLKTTAEHAGAAVAALAARHPYEVPSILVLKVDQGLPAFLGWIAAETGGG